MKDISERDLRLARKLALAHGCDMIHALGCLECSMRSETLFILSILGWDEKSFLEDYFAYLRGDTDARG